MRIAISSEEKNGLDSLVSHHFGRCPCYVLVDVDEDQKIQAVQALDNPFAIQHQPGMVPGFIHDQGADVMISGGMGRRAIGFFQEYGIQVATGANGTVRTTLENYFGGQLNGAQPCRESVEHHDHGHHHH
ncbi:MAG: NifB/NifX family molybdenum-iron cluster-binding protein [Anaerolineales bacterium]|nr:NifB/NifX family molybdenum-iron cluster-binding protein [Anaerolineales bacterium]